MKNFSELGVKPRENNMFDAPLVRISTILNCRIEVLNFDTKVKTKCGDDRYVVLFNHDGAKKKFITSANEIKDVLDQIPKEEFPFMATVKQKHFSDGRSTYCFTD